MLPALFTSRWTACRTDGCRWRRSNGTGFAATWGCCLWMLVLSGVLAHASFAPAAASLRADEITAREGPADEVPAKGACADEAAETATDDPPAAADPPAEDWRALFDGRSLAGWKVTNFGGEGEVHVVDGAMLFEFGNSLTGVTYTGKMPRTNYEISLQAKRVDGIDFFCGLTFPVGESYCSFIVGGWAGAVVGLSSIDGKDASENETTRYMNFETGRWYSIRVRVTPDRIDAWIDDRQVVGQDIRGRRITTRNEVTLSQPLGISAWETRAALRDIRIRELPAAGEADRN